MTHSLVKSHREYSRVRDSYDSRTPVYAVANPIDVPIHVDFSHKYSPVEDQETEGSCTGHAIVGAMEYRENVQHEHFVRLSRNFVYYNERLLEGTTRSDAGAQISDGIKVIQTYGVCDESLWAYGPETFKRKPPPEVYQAALSHKALKCSRVAQHENTILHFLSDRNPIVFGIMVYESFESDEVAASGFVPMPDVKTEKCLGGHAVVMAGYDLRKRLILVRNSWGVKWGIKGYFWLPFDFVLNPSLADSFWAVQSIN